MLYTRQKGITKQKYIDGSYAVLIECFFVLELGINLLSARYLYCDNITSSFDNKYIYFRRHKKTIVKVIISDGLY
jgi:hypothetical protein